MQLDYSIASLDSSPSCSPNGPMVEGWAAYIQTQLVDQGYTVYPRDPLGHDLQKVADLEAAAAFNPERDHRHQTANHAIGRKRMRSGC